MEAVYILLDVERGVPEVFNSTYDIRMLLSATGRLRDGKEIDIPGPAFLGASAHIPTLEGKVSLKIPAGTKAERQFRLRGKGLPTAGGTRGNRMG